ncbi:S-layer homology domain-containing protein [Sporosarcina sp. Sa2YVA2]|uniref:S-layer homology domain-containing protein n=1 Tax=Sporosarcina quadrami TaxID=2762234 RepID=A0ABR8UA17_9BACL|nr:S-layer homology domain-containing protein [Sporosarcina quadrami]MBD7984880.1 S-layer homology domain-containing protein [Sporosarcina quadrami]
MKKMLVTVFCAIVLTCGMPLSTVAANSQPFKDVSPKQPYAKAVNDLAARTIIGGYPDGTFKPGNPITRGQAASIIAKMLKLDTTNVKNPGFTDVSTKNGHYQAIAALAEANIIGGYEDGRYGPNDPVKRGQFASIIVKAFDLPRYYFYDTENPFKDVVEYQSHGTNVLILYRLGITSGTSPDRFSINAQITRSQAAVLLTKTEKSKPVMVTVRADELGFDRISVRSESGGIYQDLDNKNELFQSIYTYGKNPSTDGRVQLIPLKEGRGTLALGGWIDSKEVVKKYYVQVKKVNGELQLTLEETNQYLSTAAIFDMATGEKIQRVRLSTVDGTLVNDDARFGTYQYPTRKYIGIDKPGDYIATVRFTNGKDVRFAIEAKVPKDGSFYYDTQVLQEQPSLIYDVATSYDGYYTYDEQAAKNIGKHTILTENAEDIAIVQREPGTGRFHITAKSVGTIDIAFENDIYWMLGQPGDAVSGIDTGMTIHVKEMYGIVNVSVLPIFNINPDM